MRSLILWVSMGLSVSAAAFTGGDEVKRIPDADRIVGWHVLSANRLVLTTEAREQYLLTLEQSCVALGVAEQVGISTSNNAIYAGFDYVTADSAQCAISRINRVPVNL